MAEQAASAQPDTAGADGNQADLALYRLACQGDEEALEGLIARHRTGVTKFVRTMLHDPRDTEEIVLDAFAALMDNSGRFQGKSSLKT